MDKPPPFPDTARATLARFIRSQVERAHVKPVGCVQLNNAEALLCAEALETVEAIFRAGPLEALGALLRTEAQHKVLCVECGARVVDNPGASGE